MDWIILLVVAYFFIAIAVLVDKFILTKEIPQPVFYTILISTLGLAVIILAPFGFTLPDSSYQLAKTALAGGSYTLALFFLYTALKTGEASRVLAAVGALVAVITLFFSFLFLDQRLGLLQNIAFLFLVIGGVLISIRFGEKEIVGSWLWSGLSSALLFGISYTAAQSSYQDQGFVSGFIWLRIFAFLVALLFLVPKTNRQAIKKIFTAKQSGINKRSNRILIFSGQTLNGIGFILLNYLISVATAAIVLASQGLQYVFLLIFTLILAKKFPHILKEQYQPTILAQKTFAVLLIAVGLVLLTISPL